MTDFILGIIVGVFGLFVIAWHFANKQKPKPEAASVTPSAIGLDMNGTATYAQSLDEQLRIFKLQDQGRA